jgi:hypothetical protein
MYGTFDKLTVISLDQQGHERTCNYWYLVQNQHGPHTAFEKREHLLAWLERLGLTLEGELPPHGTHGWLTVTGAYRAKSHLSYDEFFALEGDRTRTLSNGRYTLGIITRDEDGLRTLHTLNPNCRDRPEFDHAESRALVG